MSVTGVLILIVVAACVVAGFLLAPKGWRTVITNVIVGVLTLVIGLAENLQSMLPEKWAWWGIVLTNGGNVVLRWLTTTPVGSPTPLPPPGR